jgi:alpha-tubulin suppressor-like RCC1 family protein
VRQADITQPHLTINHAEAIARDPRTGKARRFVPSHRGPSAQFPHGVRIASIATDVSPWNTALAIDTTGHAWGWGLNAGGDLCLGDTRKYFRPVRLPFWDVTALAGGGSHVTYDAHGTLYSCGANRYGELGDATTASSTTPVPVSGLDGALVTSLVASWSDTGALLSDGRYYDWGYNRGGQVGNGGTAPAKVPFRVPLPAPVRVVAQGGSLINNGQTIVLTRGGLVYAWGNGMHFQLGNGASGNQQSPIRISPRARVRYATVACGGATCYGVTRSGVVYAWGQGIVGELGNGMKSPARRPVKIKTREVTGISATAQDVAISTTAA